MASPALARLTQLLDTKKLAGTISRPLDQARAVTSTGRADLDHQLAGGWPQGHLSDVYGPASSGRTSVVMSTLAAVTSAGGVVGVVDVADRFDPQSAELAGVVLSRVVWVRGWAVSTRTTGDRAVQMGIRAFDLIVRAGGFAVVVCDLADVAARDLRSLPAATWLRVAHVLEGQSTVGLLVGAQAVGRSAGGVSVALRGQAAWTGQSAQSRRLTGMALTSTVAQRVRRTTCSSVSYATR